MKEEEEKWWKGKRGGGGGVGGGGGWVSGFFFQAEDGIRDIGVTGVQTCASSDLCLRDFYSNQHGGTLLNFRRKNNFILDFERIFSEKYNNCYLCNN